MIARGEALGFEAASVATSSGPQMMPALRNNDRATFEDDAFARSVWKRIRPHVPAEWEGARATGLNPRFRFYRYDPGQRFKRHKDGVVELPSGEQRSKFSFLLYLNEGYEGGRTTFSDYTFTNGERRVDEIVVTPEAGAGLFFAHARWHEGAPVTAGRKYLLRSDVMYSAAAR